jgi:hypothetical protein
MVVVGAPVPRLLSTLSLHFRARDKQASYPFDWPCAQAEEFWFTSGQGGMFNLELLSLLLREENCTLWFVNVVSELL